MFFLFFFTKNCLVGYISQHVFFLCFSHVVMCIPASSPIQFMVVKNMLNKYNKAINAIYEYVYAADPDECKKRIENILDFNIRLRHSYVDNDKQIPVSNYDINMKILQAANLAELLVVDIDGRVVDLKER